jgi:hypothetical protein
VYITQDKEEQTWPGSSVINFDPEHITMEILNRSPIWLKPVKWNQGGYDAVYIDTGKNLVRFVQVTRGKTHSFKIRFFHEFLSNLDRVPKLNFDIKRVDICFLVPKGNIGDFSISKTTGEGMLTKWGWKKGIEVDLIDIYGIDGY